MESGGDPLRQDRNSDTSNHLRELLRLREDEAGNGTGRNVPGRTLGSVLSADRNLIPVHSNRTLLDIIREDSSKDSKKTWKHFKDKLRLKRAVVAWTSSVHIPASDVPLQQNISSSSNSMNNGMMMRRHSTRIPVSDPDSTRNPATNQPSMLQSAESSAVQNDGNSAAAEEPPEEEEGMGETAEGDGEGGPVRMSLMALLAETEREMGVEGLYDEEEEEEEEESGGGGNGGAGEYNNCCVCMVRHKGAALIPCGHTFCRLCSRELWVQRGNCPLCNGYILEILDIF